MLYVYLAGTHNEHTIHRLMLMLHSECDTVNVI